MKRLTQILTITYCLMLLSSFNVIAQVDNTFWFVIPETSRAHAKTPGILKITALDQDVVVEISQPANSDFETITRTIPANSQINVQFADYGQNIKGFLEGQPHTDNNWKSGQNVELPYDGSGNLIYNQMLWTVENGTMDNVSWGGSVILENDWSSFSLDGDLNPQVNSPDEIPIFNKGLLIKATNGADFTVYYEVANTRNPERFNLKGKNALGKEFLIPSQNQYNNYTNSIKKAREKVDIVATEDNTTITFKFDPSENHFVGKPSSGDSFTITLNKGESFSLRSNNPEASSHLGGIFIESSNNIAVTISLQ